MLVKIPDAPDDLVEELKDFTGQRVASKAVLQAARMAPVLSDRLRLADEEITKLRQLISVQKQTIDRAADAARGLLDHVGQGDLING